MSRDAFSLEKLCSCGDLTSFTRDLFDSLFVDSSNESYFTKAGKESTTSANLIRAIKQDDVAASEDPNTKNTLSSLRQLISAHELWMAEVTMSLVTPVSLSSSVEEINTLSLPSLHKGDRY